MPCRLQSVETQLKPFLSEVYTVHPALFASMLTPNPLPVLQRGILFQQSFGLSRLQVLSSFYLSIRTRFFLFVCVCVYQKYVLEHRWFMLLRRCEQLLSRLPAILPSVTQTLPLWLDTICDSLPDHPVKVPTIVAHNSPISLSYTLATT